jgi:nucleoside-diphosphate-sugar epimerase
VKICLVGAGGGIGRQLVKTFASAHDVSAVYRTLPQHAPAHIETVRFADDDGLMQAIGDADVVVHAALNTKARGKDFIPSNRDVTERLLSLIQPETCRLFVYFSSQVVYAALDPVQHPVQGEDAELADRPGLDNYTRLKILEEKRVISVCREKGIDYLIVRPTVVMGPNMQWSSGIVSAMRMAPFGLKGRTINLIHVEDLSHQLLALIERGIKNTVVNLGDLDVSSDEYFRHAASLAHRPMFFAPNWLSGAAGRAIPSTLWFFAHNVQVASEKVRQLSGVTTNRQLSDFFEPPARVVEARSLDTIVDMVRTGRPYHTIGRGYFLWFNDKLDTDQLVMENYAGIVRQEGEFLTVRAGTTLRAVLDHLAPQNMTLGTLPEFVDISAGACFFAEVHGSSADFISIYDLITAIRYVDRDGEEKFSQRNDYEWDRLREGNGIIVTEVTFRCRPNFRLANVIEWHPDSQLESYVEGGYLANFSTTVHWYPRSREMMVYNVNPLTDDHPKDRGPFAPMRGSPAAMQKLLLSLRLRGRLRIVGYSEQVLAPWTGVPAKQLVGKLFRDARRRVRNMEVCVPDAFAASFIAGLRKKMPEMSLTPGQGVGVRFTRQPSTGRGFVWVEMTSRNAEQMHSMIDIAREACGNAFWIHRGKYVPSWIGIDHLFIPRAGGIALDVPAQDAGSIALPERS